MRLTVRDRDLTNKKNKKSIEKIHLLLFSELEIKKLFHT